MVLKKNLISILSLLLFLSVSVIAQEKEMTSDEWQAEMSRLTAQKAALLQEDSTLNADIDNLKSMDIKSFEDCTNELYALVGATKSDVDNFRSAVEDFFSSP